MSRTLLVVTVILAGAVAVWLGALGARPIQVRMPAPLASTNSVVMPKGAALGQSGCLATACHGAPAGKTLAGDFDGLTWMSSGSCFIATDPHCGTYDLLTDSPRRPVRVTAAEMMTRLGSTAPATEDSRCLACHANPSLAEPGRTADVRLLTLRHEGVSCEACHGNAIGWVREHTVGNRGDNLTGLGMTRLATSGDRATACVGCHVGAGSDPERGLATRDMNHDMIAAGHPRLNFDFAEYMRRLPKHWRDETAINPAREWLVGRVAGAEAACKLLADRAGRAAAGEERTPWPEFADHNCAACHHRFANPDDPVERSSGALKWQTIWPTTARDEAGRPELASLLAELRSPRPPAPAKLIAPARQAATDLEARRKSLDTMPDKKLLPLAHGLFPASVPKGSDTDAYGHVLHGLAALGRAEPKPGAADDFRRAFEKFHVRPHDWKGVRLSLDELLGRMRK